MKKLLAALLVIMLLCGGLAVGASASAPYTVTYDPNATGVTNLPAPVTENFGDYHFVSTMEPQRAGYIFKGWATNNAGPVVYPHPIDATHFYGDNVDVTFYAIWEAIPTVTYTVTYNANGGAGGPAPDTKPVSEYVIISATVPVLAGFIFKGWIDPATGKEYVAGDLYAENVDATLNAVWEAIPAVTTYTVTYNTNGGTGGPASDTKPVGEYVIISATVPVLAGFTFKGWIDPATGKKYAAGDLYAENVNATLNAVWEAVSTGNNPTGPGWWYFNPIFFIWFGVRLVIWLFFGWLWMPMPAWGVWR